METSTNLLTQQGFTNMQEDILSQIFLLLSRDYDDSNHYIRHKQYGKGTWDWVSVSEVCRYWHAVATGTPNLWSFLDNFHWSKRFQMSVRLSKNADLTISFVIATGNLDVEFVNLKIAMREMRRITQLTLIAQLNEAQAAELLPYFELPAPSMQSFWISIPALTLLSRFHLPYTLPGILRKVDLDVISAPSLISGLTRLSDLSLRNCSFSLSALSGVLNASPELKQLSISSCRIDYSNSSNLESAHLPYLENLHMNYDQATICFDVLRMIEAPNISFWSIHIDGRMSVEDTEKLDVFAKFLKSDDHVDETIIGAAYSAELGGRMRFMGSQRHLSFEFNQAHKNVILQRWIGIFQRHLTRISLLDVTDVISMENWRSLFNACASAKVLKIYLDYGLENLEDDSFEVPTRKPRSIDELGGSFPALEHLFVEPYLEDTDDTERFVGELKDLLERRLENGFPACKVTAHSMHAQSDCVLHEGLEELGLLRHWAEELLVRVRKWEDGSDLEDSEAERHVDFEASANDFLVH